MSITRLPLDFSVPGYLAHDIQALIDHIDGINDDPLDCLECEILGSANMALMSGAINEDQAKFIRAYYAYGGYYNAAD